MTHVQCNFFSGVCGEPEKNVSAMGWRGMSRFQMDTPYHIPPLSLSLLSLSPSLSLSYLSLPLSLYYLSLSLSLSYLSLSLSFSLNEIFQVPVCVCVCVCMGAGERLKEE